MSNVIGEKYFDPEEGRPLDEIISEIGSFLGFKPDKTIFEGKIYGGPLRAAAVSGIYKDPSADKEVPAVLKIQVMKLEEDEVFIYEKFLAYNQSPTIRLPKIYQSSPWNEAEGYGYLLLEEVKGDHLYEEPFASEEGMKRFTQFYDEYKQRAVTRPFFALMDDEKYSRQFTERRVRKWQQIAEDKKSFQDRYNAYITEYFEAVAKDSLPMEFMHGHITRDDVIVVPTGERVLLANVYWSYRPQYYDTTFHLWAAVKKITDFSITPENIIEYIETWKEAYKKIPFISEDPGFEKAFYLNLMERCVGAFLVDLENQGYPSEPEKHINHLRGIFEALLRHCQNKLR